MTCGLAPRKNLEVCSCVHSSSACICAYVSEMCQLVVHAVCYVSEQMQMQKKRMCGHCYVIHGTSCILERHCGLQGERADPLHHHYHYHHQSSFKWCSWSRQCTEPLAWPHLDIAFEMGEMEGERTEGKNERDKGHGEKERGWEENTPGGKVMLKK